MNLRRLQLRARGCSISVARVRDLKNMRFERARTTRNWIVNKFWLFGERAHIEYRLCKTLCAVMTVDGGEFGPRAAVSLPIVSMPF